MPCAHRLVWCRRGVYHLRDAGFARQGPRPGRWVCDRRGI